MTKLKNIIKFIIIFTTTTLLPLGAYFYYKHHQVPPSIIQFDDVNIRKTCPDSPEKEFYSLCLQKKLSRMYSEASLFDIHKITVLLREIKDRDLYVTNFKKKSKSKLYEIYLYSWIISIDHLRNFKRIRKETSFIEIFAFPIFRNSTQEQISILKAEVLTLDVPKSNKLIELQSKILSVNWE